MQNPAQQYTIQEFINAGKTIQITHYNCSLVEKIGEGTIEYPVMNILNDYEEEIKELAIVVTLSDKEFNKYQFSPKKLAYDIYGYTDFFFIIMFLNDINDVKDFNMKKIKLLKKSDLGIINTILNAEKAVIANNRLKLTNG